MLNFSPFYQVVDSSYPRPQVPKRFPHETAKSGNQEFTQHIGSGQVLCRCKKKLLDPRAVKWCCYMERVWRAQECEEGVQSGCASVATLSVDDG